MEPIVGVNYFDHQFLRKDDFDVARTHHVDRLRQHDLVAHTTGIVAGLEVHRVDSQTISVSFGRAIDRDDYEVVLDKDRPPLVTLEADPEKQVTPTGLVTVEAGLDNAQQPTAYTIQLVYARKNRPLLVKIRRDEFPSDERADPGVVENARLRERPQIEVGGDASGGFIVLGTVNFDGGGNIPAGADPSAPLDAGRSESAGSVIGDRAVVERNLADDSVSRRTIQDGAVDTARLADDAVTSQKLDEADNASDQDTDKGSGVKTGHLADDAVTSAKLASQQVLERHMADDSVSRRTIRDAAVDTDRLADVAVTSAKIADVQVLERHLATDSVTSNKIASAQVLERHLQDDAVSRRTIQDAAVDTDRLAPDAVSSPKLAEADNATDQSTNVGRGVKTGHLTNEAVTIDKLDPAVRNGLAAGYCAFNGTTGVLLSHHNVDSVTRKSDRLGHYVVTWRDPIGAERTLPPFSRPGIPLSPDLRKLLLGDVPDRAAASSLLAEAFSTAAGRLTAAAAQQVAADPSAPDYVGAVSVTEAQAVIAWTPSEAGGAPVAGYEVARDGAAAVRIDARVFTDSAVVQGKTHTYAVVAVDAAGHRSPPATVAVEIPDRTPPAVSGAPAVAVVPEGVQLSWLAAPDNVGVDHYEVMRNGLRVGTTPTPGFLDRSVLSQRSYAYSVAVVDKAGNRAQSVATGINVGDRLAPSAPTGLAGVPVAANRAGVMWSASTDDVQVAGYRVLRDGQQVGLVGVPFFLDTAAVPGATHFYSVIARDPAGHETSAPSGVSVQMPPLPVFAFFQTDQVPPTPPPGPPAVQVQPDSTVRLTWPAASDDHGVVSGYVVLRDGTPIGAAGGPAYVDRNAVQGAVHTYSVQAFDPSGNASQPSQPAAAVRVPDRVAPTQPAFPTVTERTSSSITVAFGESTDNNAVARYDVFRDGSQISSITPNPSGSYAFSSAPHPPGHTVAFRIDAVDVDGNRTSAGLSASTIDNVPPTTPTALVAAAASGAVKLSWNRSTDESGVATYRVFRDGAPLPDVASNATADERVRPLRIYTYTVAAIDQAGNVSPQSGPVSVETRDTSPPTVPQDVKAEGVSPYEVHVAWQPSTDAAGIARYEVFRDGVSVGTTGPTTTEFHDFNVRPKQTYAYTVTARDAAGNVSAQSDKAEVAIPAEPDGDRPLGTVLAYAYLPGYQRQVHVVTATPEAVEVQLVNAADGSPADGFLNVAGFRPTAEADPVVSLEDLNERAPLDVVGGALGRLTADEAATVLDRFPADRVEELIPVTPDERLPQLTEAVDPAVLGDAIAALPDAQKGRVIDAADPATVSDLVGHLSGDAITELIGRIGGDRMTEVVNAGSPVALGDLMAAASGDDLNRIVDAAPPATLADAVLRVEPEKAGEAVSKLSDEATRTLVLSAPVESRADIATLVPTDRLTTAVASGTDEQRTALLDATPDAKVAEVIAAASDSERAAIVDAAGGAVLAGALVAADDASRERIVSEVAPEKLAEAITAGAGVGVADVIPADRVADAIVAAPEETRTAVVASVSDAKLAETVAAAPEETRGDIVAATSDAQLASVLIAAAPDSKPAIAASIDEARAPAVIDAAPLASRTLVDSFLIG